ncbi:MAG: hypothetical protein PHP56_12270 [Smithellaceae bacterium]|nr:hypothetical protein [Smithellaceae bacterium]
MKGTEKSTTGIEMAMAQFTQFSKITKDQLEYFKRHGTDLSYDDPIRKVHVEAYETDEGVCFGAITPLDSPEQTPEQMPDQTDAAPES